MKTIKVSSSSIPSSVAGSIAHAFREDRLAYVQAVGAAAVHKAVKAIILARGYIENDGNAIAVLPEYIYVTIEGKIITAIRFVISPNEYGTPA